MSFLNFLSFARSCVVALCVVLIACDGGESRPDAGNITCGDGVCDAADGETMESCEKDCSGRCVAFPNDPVFCWDPRGNPTCNPVGTDCELPIMYECGSGPRRCPDYVSFGRCCDIDDIRSSSDVIWCPSQASCQNPVTSPRVCYGPVFSCATGN
jgi:hypothetical protein